MHGAGQATVGPAATTTGEGPLVARGLGERQVLLGLLGLALVAFIVRLVGVVAGAGLRGDYGFDDSVYLGAAISFIEGRVPYKDFNLLHPPGIIYALTPVAALGGIVGDSNALAVMRLAFCLLGAVNTVLVGLVGRRALGPGVGLAAAALYAVWFVPVNVEHTAWLIGPQSTLLLVALLALAGRTGSTLTWRRVVVAGLCLGISGAFQVWSALPAAVVFGWLIVVLRHTPGRLLRLVAAYVVAGLAAVAVLLGPMLAAAGPRMLQLIIWTQLARAEPGERLIVQRMRMLEGLPKSHLVELLVPGPLVVGAFAGALLVVAILAWRRPQTRLWAALLVAKLAFLFYTAVFYRHYGGWLAPEATLLAGTAIVMALGSLRRPVARRVAIAALGILVVVLAVVSMRPTGKVVPITAATPDLSGAGCVTADSPLLLIRTETMRRNLDRGCPLLLNAGGLSNILNAERTGPRLSRATLPEYQSALRDFFGSGDAALFMRLPKLSLSDETWRAISGELPIRQEIGPVTVLLRRQP